MLYPTRPAAPFHHPASSARLRDRVSVVVITRNRRDELLHTLGKLTSLPGSPRVIVVDNGSSDDTPSLVEAIFPDVCIMRLGRNLGAAGRNIGVAMASTPYVAFADDDSWWAPDALEIAASTLDAHARLSVVAARVLVASNRALDPTCVIMRDSGLPPFKDMPGIPVFGFLACGSVVRRQRFLEAGGFPQRFGIGGEEAALALALAAGGSALSYLEEVVAFHHPSRIRDADARRTAVTRNDLWIAWEFRPTVVALKWTRRAIGRSFRDASVRRGVIAAFRELSTVLRTRRRVPPDVERALKILDPPRRSRSRRADASGGTPRPKGCCPDVNS